MNFTNILREIEKAGTGEHEKQSDRREVLKSFGAKVAIAALPIAVSSLFKKSYARTTATESVVTALNFILELEYLEYAFFTTGVNTGSLIPAADVPGFQTIMTQDGEQIALLIAAVTALGGTPYEPKNYGASTTNPPYVPAGFDFTAGGTYPLVFSDYPTFLIVAQIIKDTAVHAYKGQLQYLISNTTLFIQMMELQCTEARHAAHTRLVRRLLTTTVATDYPAPWITEAIAPTPALLPYYNGDGGVDLTENNTIQNGIQINNLADKYSTTAVIPQISASAAFDETMDMATVLSLLGPFIVA